MKIDMYPASLLAVLALATTSAPAQVQEAKDALVDSLNHSYSFTQPRGDWDRIKTPGAIYAVHVSGLRAHPVTDGTIPTFTIQPPAHPHEDLSLRGVLSDNQDTRDVQPGEHFYLTAIDVDARYVAFHLLSVDAYTVVTEGYSNQERFLLTLKFPLKAGAIATLTTNDVHKLVDPTLSPAAAGQSTLKLGQTQDEVEQLLGVPDQEVELGAKHILVYKSVKVILLEGKVTDIQ